MIRKAIVAFAALALVGGLGVANVEAQAQKKQVQKRAVKQPPIKAPKKKQNARELLDELFGLSGG